MTGLVLLADPPDSKHLRLIFRLRGRRAKQILFWDQRGLAVAQLMSPEQFLRCCGPARLGPDALTIGPQTLRERLHGSRRPIKVALLDQHVVAGIGNLYASEILHLAGIHPAVPCCWLRAAQWSKLHSATGDVLRAAIRHQGSTLRDGTYRIARNKRGAYQVYHRVYQRAGQPCLDCGAGQIVRIVQAQRSTFFCPICQPPCSSRRRR
jgi:formamidopyrimidine-DNA glycosylase